MTPSKHIFLFGMLLVLLLLPSRLFNNNHTHDWGDDFAQYIYQAQEIKNPDTPQKQVININEYGSNKRGIVFSAILSLEPAFKGIQPYLTTVFLFFILSSVAVFLFFNRHFPPVLSLFMTLSIYYNYHVIQLKEVVMTEFAFMLLLYGIYWFHQRKNNQSTTFIMGSSFALLTGIRSVGFVFFMAYLTVVLLKKEVTIAERLKTVAISSLTYVSTSLAIQLLLLPELGLSSMQFYQNLFAEQLQPSFLVNNVMAYALHFRLLFEQELPASINVLLLLVVVLSMLIGLCKELLKQPDLPSISLVFYFIFLLLYPYNGACIRFLVPVLPLIFYYSMKGLYFIFGKLKAFVPYTLPLSCVFALLLLLSNTKTLWLDAQVHKNEFGPYRSSIQADFNQIKKSTSEDATIAFSKPFLINLFCRRKAYFYNEKNSNTIKSRADYLLLVNDRRLDEVYQPQLLNVVSGKDTMRLQHFLLIKLK